MNWLLLLNLSLCFSFTYCFYSFPLINPKTCKDTEYYNTIRFICASCGTGDQNKYQQRSEDGMSCVCRTNHKLISQDGDTIKCEPCPYNHVTSYDGWNCYPCSNENPFDNSTEKCSYCNNGIRVEKLNENNITEHACFPCPSYTWPDNTASRCVHCPKDFQDSNGICNCPVGKNGQHVLTGGSCISKKDLIPNNPSQTTIRYQNGFSVQSNFFVQHFQAVVFNCKSLKNATACQCLANMCVLLLYNMDNYHSGKSDACSEYLSFTYKQNVHLNQWPPHSPWIYYKTDAKTELSKTNIPFEFSPNPSFGPNKLHFLVAKYALNGQFLTYESITENVLKFCGIPGSRQESILTFGTAFHITCNMKTQDLWNDAELFFYELFLAANESLDHNLIYPVPVLILNYRSEDNPINKDSDASKWQLVRRFFLYDPISGMESAQHSTLKQKRIAKVLRYASHISLDIRSQKDGKVGTILPPLLTLEYTELASDDYYKNEMIPTTFTVSYSMDQTKVFEDISIAIGVLSGFSILWSAIQTWGWSRRSGREVIDLAALGKLLIFACGNLSSIFFIVMIACSLNWMILFKKQDVFHLFLPTPEQEKKIKIYLIFAFIMKFLQLIHILSVQCTVDVFFIDWERPRMHGLTAKLTPQKPAQSGTGEIGTSLGPKKDKSNGERNSDSPAVSIWRTYFVAKEWCDIQCLRRVQLGFHLLAVLFFLKGIGFENFAHADPKTEFSPENIHVNIPYSFICRFSVGSCTYIILAAIQVILRKLIYERFFQDRLQEFVDLCSVSNISVFVMSARQFGYYIHGHSAHGRADVNMREMHELLRREEEDLCGHRGLLPNTEQQTFQMCLPALVREQYEHLLLPLNSYSQAADRMQGAGGRLSRVDIDKVANIYHTVKKFLSGFIEHTFKDLDYVIKDKLFLESLLDVEFIENTDRGCFYNDNGYSFDSILFRGQEVTIIIFEVLLFTIVDMIAEDFIYSAIVTFIVAKIIKSARQSIGKRNVVKKALIDERFLG